MDQSDELFKLTDEIDILNSLKNAAIAGDQDRLEEYAERFNEHAEHVQEVCKLLFHVATNETLQISSKNTEACLCVYGPQILSACHTLGVHPTSKIAKENLAVFIDLWLTLFNDVHHLSRDITELCRNTDRYNLYPLRQNKLQKSVTIREASDTQSNDGLQPEPPMLAQQGATASCQFAKPLDSIEQERIAKAGLEMKLAATEMDAEAGKWPDAEDNDIVRKAKAMSQMAFLMYQFTRGEGELKTTQDLFTQAEFCAEEANGFYKIVRNFTYKVLADLFVHRLTPLSL